MLRSCYCLLVILAFSQALDRVYFVAADEVTWDYAPLNKDGSTGQLFNQTMEEGYMNMNGMMESLATWVLAGPKRIGKVFKKVIYREYTDASFSTLKNRSSEWKHLGYLGPVLQAEVGDTLKVTFRNNGNKPYTMHPHGVFYQKKDEGVPQMDSMSMAMAMDGNYVLPGMQWTYTWEVPERAGPTTDDPSSIVWMYHSHVDETMDVNSGLVGPIIVTRAGFADQSGKPTDVTREFVVMFTIIDENLSWYLEENMNQTVAIMSGNMTMVELQSNEEFMMSNQKHSVNGFLYSNLLGLTMMINETVRWHVISVGNEVDLHGVHWHGQTLIYDRHRVDVVELIPASMKTLDMIPDNEGTWLFHCHTNHHIIGGMTATFDVLPCPASCPRPPSDGTMVSVATSYFHPTFSFFGIVLYWFLI